VQSILGTTEAAVLPTTEQADNMIVSGWQASKVFDTGNTINTVNGGNMLKYLFFIYLSIIIMPKIDTPKPQLRGFMVELAILH
jgi:hypothetical protein